jgi:hypothetical protein
MEILNKIWNNDGKHATMDGWYHELLEKSWQHPPNFIHGRRLILIMKLVGSCLLANRDKTISNEQQCQELCGLLKHLIVVRSRETN